MLLLMQLGQKSRPLHEKASQILFRMALNKVKGTSKKLKKAVSRKMAINLRNSTYPNCALPDISSLPTMTNASKKNPLCANSICR